MRNGAILAVIAGAALLNGLYLDAIPLWRQLFFLVPVVAAYLHGRHLTLRRGWPVHALVALPGVVCTVLDFPVGVGGLMALGLFAVLPWLTGRFQRQQADLVRAGRERVAQLRREQEFTAERVALRERARIAADIHDSLGHELALIALRAGALELDADMSERNREAAARLRACAVTATDRLRHTVGVLRETGGAPAGTPEESVEALVDRARGAGMRVALLRTGGRALLPPLVDRAAHGVVRESLTNAARHAPGAEVTVRVEHARDAVTVTVSNSAARTPPAPASGGSGIAGLRERVRLLGGTLRAGPRDGGFTVTARLPCDREGASREEEDDLPAVPGQQGDPETRGARGEGGGGR
ncbi:histidine kinase [Sphaerisporangium sp. NPDC005289]|uniref:sensor histidine kinase n=1 Tax=Sphaerisporangium sp. NPDC005289 TaxID=3155247 RepID=UPI0033A83756